MSDKKQKKTYQQLAEKMLQLMDDLDAGKIEIAHADSMANICGKTMKVYAQKHKHIELQQKGYTGLMDFFEDPSEE